jgi:hypothetical protein
MTQGLLQDLVALAAVPPQYRRRGYRHASSWVFIGSFFAVVLGQGPFVIRSLGGSATQSLLLNVAQGIPLIPAILWVHLIERHNPVRLTGLFLGLGGVVMVFSGLARGMASLSIFMAASLALITFYRPIMGTALEQIYPTQWRGQLQALPNAVNMLVSMACLWGVGRLLLGNLEVWHIVFPLAGLSMIVGAVLFRRIGGSRGNRQAGGLPDSWRDHLRNSLRGAVSNRPLLYTLIGYFFVTCGGVVYSNVLPLYARDHIGLDTARWGLVCATNLGATLVCFWTWGRFMDRFGALVTILITWAGMGLLMGSLFFVHGWTGFLIVVTAYGIFMSGNILAFFPIVMHFTRSAETMRGMGLHSTLWGIRWLTMPGLVMVTVDAHLFDQRYLFLLGLGLVIIGLAIIGRVWRQERRNTPAAESAA